jgi:signal transduction histidine kinase
MLVSMQPAMAHLTLVDGLRLVSALVWVGSGTLLLVRARPNRMTVLTGCMLLTNGVSGPVVEATDSTGAALVGRLVLAVALTLAVLTISVFPDGRFRPVWLRWVAVAFGAWQAMAAVVGQLGTVLDVLGGVVFFAGFVVPLVAQVSRYRHATDPRQQVQIRWVLYGVGLAIGVSLLVSLPYFAPGWFPDLVAAGSPYDSFQETVSALAVLAVPICFLFAMLFANLFDVDVVITRTLVYGSLSLLVAACYLVVVTATGVLVGEGDGRLAPLVGAAIVALLVGPLRSLLQSRVRRLVYGMRAEPYAALAGLSRRLAASVPDGDVPTELVSTIREALRAPYVALAVGVDGAFPITAEQGRATSHTLSMPVHHRGEQVGVLIVGYDAGRPLSAPDRALLVDLASHAGSAIHSLQLTTSLRQSAEELQSARERLVLTREEERRRLRRDLHDGLAPTLAAAGLTAATAHDLVRRDPDTAEQVLDTLQRNMRAAVADIRTLVDELRPPALELGLMTAIKERTAELGQLMETRVEGPDNLPALPAAVEVAAYRICQEALMNVLKHADAHHVHVRLRAGDLLTLEIQDDGVGLAGPTTSGIGLGSMHERAAEVGGRCTISVPECGGTRVSVCFPLSARALT